MSKFCKNCGEEMNDAAAFCNKCGAQVNADAACEASCENCGSQCEGAKAETGIAGKINAFVDKIKNKDKKAIGIVAGIVVVLIVILVLGFVLGSSGPEKAIDNMLDVVYKGKASKVEKLAPDAYWEYMEDERDVKVKDIEKLIEDAAEETMDSLEDVYGEDVKIKVKVVETDEVGKSTLNDMKDTIKENYDIPKKEVTDAVELECEMTIKGDDDEETEDMTVYAVKIAGDWYLCNEDGTLVYADLYVGLAALANNEDSGLGDFGDLLG